MRSTPSALRTAFVMLGSHLDLFWMGTHQECLARGVEIQRRALDIMEAHPQYCYYIETTLFADYHLRCYPEDRQRFEQLYREGRLEVGATFVDRVEHSHSGESLIRHAVEGMRWLDANLGPGVRTVCHPDLPGLSPQIPQIYAQTGVAAYLHGRASGAIHDWVAPDGSRILYVNLFHYGEKLTGHLLEVLSQPNLPEQILVRGGYGDLVNVSTHVLQVLDEARSQRPDLTIEMVSPRTALQALAEHELPTLHGEIPYGWGSLGSGFVRIMAQSAALEHQLLTLEKVAALLRVQGHPLPTLPTTDDPAGEWAHKRGLAGDIYGEPIRQGEELYELWRVELLCQDHNYGGRHGAQSNFDREVLREGALRTSRLLLEDGLRSLVGTSGSADSLAVFNPVSWERQDMLLLSDDRPETIELLGPDQQALPAQRCEEGLMVALPTLPPLSASVLPLRRRASSSTASHFSDKLATPPLWMEVDSATGQVRRLRDVAAKRDLLASSERGLGEIITLKDDGVDVRYGPVGVIESDSTTEYKVVTSEEGPVFSRLTLRGTFLDSQVEKSYTLFHHAPRLDLTLRVWWWGKRGEHLQLCMPFAQEEFHETWYGVPLAAQRWPDMAQGEGISEQAILEAGEEYGDMLRPADRRHYREVIGWLDVGYLDYGVTIGTRSTCWWIDGPSLRAALLRTQYSCGDPNLWNLNPGLHTWTFRIEPHVGDWRASHAYRVGEEQLNPLEALRVSSAPGETKQPAQRLHIGVTPDHVLITACMPADGDERALLVRVLECDGRQAHVTLRLPTTIREATLVDLMGHATAAATVDGSRAQFTLRPFGLQTIRLALC